MVSLGQPDLIKDSQTVYMHQITLHALCSAARSVAPQYPSSLLFPLPPYFSVFPSSPSRPQTLPLLLLAIKKAGSSPAPRNVFIPPSCFQSPFSWDPASDCNSQPRSILIASFLSSYCEVKSSAMDPAASWKPTSTESDHPLRSMCKPFLSLCWSLSPFSNTSFFLSLLYPLSFSSGYISVSF